MDTYACIQPPNQAIYMNTEARRGGVRACGLQLPVTASANTGTVGSLDTHDPNSVCVRSRFSCVRLFCDPTGCTPPGSTRGILQERTLEWVAISFSRGSFRPRDRAWVSRLLRCREGSFTSGATWAAQTLAKFHPNLRRGCDLPRQRATGRMTRRLQAEC